MIDFEFYETPNAFTRYLFSAMTKHRPIVGTIVEPCVGSGAIVRASLECAYAAQRRWVTNDLDERWPATTHADARQLIAPGDWWISNPAFTPAVGIVQQGFTQATVDVAMHLRASIHEVLKTGIRRTFLAQHTPTGILWLPRFAYQRSPTTGKWTTDSVCACWVIWMFDPRIPQFIEYAPERVIDELDAETPAYREQMDRIMAERKAVA